MTTYISQLDVSLTEAEETTLKSKGFQKVNVNLNEGAGGKTIYLWFKLGPDAITRLQVTFNYEMGVGLEKAGYTKISKNLNTGNGGDDIYLWFFKGNTPYDIPIKKIEVTNDAETEAMKFTNDWESLACDLNRGAGGRFIYAWVKREKPTFICDVTATASYDTDQSYLKEGYIRVDEDANKGTGGAPVYIWYRQTIGPQPALNLLQVSINDSQFEQLQQQKYTQVNVNLNQGTSGASVYLWYKKEEGSSPIKAISMLLDPAQIQAYETAGVNVIKRNLNQGTQGQMEYLCVNQ
ncbi:uncharacterized protein [Clinocottus analis]|uniref:uncharacterized protein n=1 Tax=Clinocottus analis TaxID=304258 RepID=UPI0035C0E65D